MILSQPSFFGRYVDFREATARDSNFWSWLMILSMQVLDGCYGRGVPREIIIYWLHYRDHKLVDVIPASGWNTSLLQHVRKRNHQYYIYSFQRKHTIYLSSFSSSPCEWFSSSKWWYCIFFHGFRSNLLSWPWCFCCFFGSGGGRIGSGHILYRFWRSHPKSGGTSGRVSPVESGFGAKILLFHCVHFRQLNRAMSC